MRLKTNFGQFEIASISIDTDSGRILLLGGDGSSLIGINNPFQKFEINLDCSGYEVILFYRDNWPESQLWTLTEGGRDVGHVFSVAALAGANPSLVNDRYARFGAAVALKALCCGLTRNTTATSECVVGATIDIDQLYDENLVIAIISKERVLSIGSVVQNWNQYLRDRIPVFSGNGLHFQEFVSSRQTFDSGSTTSAVASYKNLTLSGISGFLPAAARDYFHEVIASVIPYQEHPAFRFFLCYQMLEILMEDIHGQVVSNFVNSMHEKGGSEIRKMLSSFRDDLRESSRIQRIFQANHIPQVFGDLQRACNRVLVATQQQEEGDAGSAVYAVRNILFHNFQSAHGYSAELIETSESFFQFICQLALQYRSHPLPRDMS